MAEILYQFSVPGYIPGYPGVFPAGSYAKVDSETNALLETGTLQSQAGPSPEPQSSVPDAPIEAALAEPAPVYTPPSSAGLGG